MKYIRHLFVAILISASTSDAQVYTPRVNNSRLPDYTEIGRFVEFDAWRNLPPQEKATALWSWLTDSITGLYPVQGIYEDPDPGPAFPFFDERDLVKVLNVHGHGYCGLLSPTLDGIYAAAGFPDSRIHNMDANHHCITEVYYDSGWHYYDMDLRGMLYRPDGTVASAWDAMTVRSLWTEPSRRIEPFYPLDDKPGMYESFRACKLTPMYHWYKNGHTMDYILRPGESITRWWQPQGGRWFQSWPNQGGFDYSFLTRKFNQEPRGLKSKHDGWSKWTHGNALFSYSPRLGSAWQDFQRGAYDFRDVEPRALGIVATSDRGYAVFEVRTPYIIVGKVYELDRPDKIDDAATVSYRSLGAVKVNVSTDNALTWQTVGGVDHAGSQALDLTGQVLHGYGYLVRFDFDREGSGLAELAIDTWCQLAPVSLPRLLAGENRMSFSLGDRYGWPTTVREIRLNLRNPARLERHLAKMQADYDPLRDSQKLKGEAVIRVPAKPGSRIKWFTAGGYFYTYPGKETVNTKNAIYYSTAGPDGPWRPVATSKVPDWVLSWHYGLDQDVVLDEPADTVFVRYVGDPAVNQIWIYAHCLPEEVPESARVRLTHGYEIGGQYLEKSFSFEGPGEYVVDCQSTPENRLIRFECPSVPAQE